VRADIRAARIVFHENASGAHWQDAARKAKAALKAAFGPRLVELSEASLPSGAEFGYPLLSPDGARELLRRKVRNIAAAQADIVVTGSHASAAHIARGLEKYYPRAQAVHCSVLLDEALKG
ncbi:MAG: (Fe-S)-binding protein, partial [Elusimicrobiales bacterium]|nr:(Fe-S)-binding protein [Elusimicrobiales bacterium]